MSFTDKPIYQPPCISVQVPEKTPGYFKYRSGGISLQGFYEKKVKFVPFSPKMVSLKLKKRKKIP
jgi:hypothetical protein